MSFETDTATRCFSENLRLFGPPRAEPEKYNLYQGLANLAQAIDHIEQAVKRLESQR